MQSLPQNNNSSANSTQQLSNSSVNTVTTSGNQLGNNTAIPIEAVQSTNKNLILSIDSKKLLILGLVIIGIVATFFLVTRGNELCLFSFCTDVGRHSATLTSDFWAFAGGTATVIVLTTFLGVSLLPAVGIASAVWFFIYSSLHLS
ncbi:hypothetical protein [Nostoc sp. 'Peltigera membranacea cyanobiont' N6]|uniref:hypothetical protein n=1 Tax=Nostoc sp. 'Peltigera membranacea cyanobiont' N6 TaxID=1261031 RepID=UPI000CF34ECC|nr:hypothetical protein [Nostoc sp. 'Peltigera membranacea cyanobiont' N6]AVH68451.1 hypothetical protein NPM_40006 [Nostoc sp. 'Peltigera membranacea cyanobiont' N6]